MQPMERGASLSVRIRCREELQLAELIEEFLDLLMRGPCVEPVKLRVNIHDPVQARIFTQFLDDADGANVESDTLLSEGIGGQSILFDAEAP